ncbi:IMPACT family protein [Sphaerochaeta globosa]|jgi:uncharacterized YigZ family protein|uniref:Uncharacterized protein family UPF0029, Impact, N-terminal protein n=1 Tax=Sphaerochaeta globosa (strain ATCC BAA-1886 / DSM 22777 / Buddy) TaxID=158189 RepID=F0RZT7_SPHGB|nr:YigZ family protein [Sphaerochaeta globosa]ADY14838.1 Uncharacterized protein family UPF0029, Impact, N-terminal protein [Sphaerochaeta globosa str. Buddy]
MQILLEQATCEIEVKKSRFIAIACPLSNLAQIKEMVNQTRAQHPGANHVVHAAVLGPKGDLQSYSDDHEPKNTAGRPALEVLKGSEVTNILVMVIRYFGGTLLGTGGLVKAYADSVKEVLRIIKTEPLIDKTPFQVTMPYHLYEPIKKQLTDLNATIESEEFTTIVTLTGMLPSASFSDCAASIYNLSNGSCTLGSIDG